MSTLLAVLSTTALASVLTVSAPTSADKQYCVDVTTPTAVQPPTACVVDPTAFTS